jgi:hypothetical protein
VDVDDVRVVNRADPDADLPGPLLGQLIDNDGAVMLDAAVDQAGRSPDGSPLLGQVPTLGLFRAAHRLIYPGLGLIIELTYFGLEIPDQLSQLGARPKNLQAVRDQGGDRLGPALGDLDGGPLIEVAAERYSYLPGHTAITRVALTAQDVPGDRHD